MRISLYTGVSIASIHGNHRIIKYTATPADLAGVAFLKGGKILKEVNEKNTYEFRVEEEMRKWLATSSFMFLTIHDPAGFHSSGILCSLRLFRIDILLPVRDSFSRASTGTDHFRGGGIPKEIPVHVFRRLLAL